MEEGLKVYYWKGWITPDNMKSPGWLESWAKSAQDAKDNGFELVVFSIPKNKASGTADTAIISTIEQLLQDKFGIDK